MSKRFDCELGQPGSPGGSCKFWSKILYTSESKCRKNLECDPSLGCKEYIPGESPKVKGLGFVKVKQCAYCNRNSSYFLITDEEDNIILTVCKECGHWERFEAKEVK